MRHSNVNRVHAHSVSQIQHTQRGRIAAITGKEEQRACETDSVLGTQYHKQFKGHRKEGGLQGGSSVTFLKHLKTCLV